MKKCLTFNDHKTLQLQLKCMRLEMKEKENGMIKDTKQYVKSIPKSIFLSKKSAIHGSVSNPVGKVLAKGVNSTLLKNQGFITKMITGLFLKRVGKNIENKLLKN